LLLQDLLEKILKKEDKKHAIIGIVLTHLLTNNYLTKQTLLPPVLVVVLIRYQKLIGKLMQKIGMDRILMESCFPVNG